MLLLPLFMTIIWLDTLCVFKEKYKCHMHYDKIQTEIQPPILCTSTLILSIIWLGKSALEITLAQFLCVCYVLRSHFGCATE